jgi:hypothetical protein
MVTALWISLIGMGLVFLAILLLWGLMALLVRLTAEKPALHEDATQVVPAAQEVPAAPIMPAAQPAEPPAPVTGNEARERRRRAAAAGVAVAIALQREGRGSPAPAWGGGVWQSLQRASQLGQRNGFSRKVRQ